MSFSKINKIFYRNLVKKLFNCNSSVLDSLLVPFMPGFDKLSQRIIEFAEIRASRVRLYRNDEGEGR
jgi:hypothetical protein